MVVVRSAPEPKPRAVICQVLHSLCVGGAEVLAREFALACRDEFDTVFACLDEVGYLGEQLKQDGFEVALLGRRSGVDWRVTRRLASFTRTRKVALIHAHQYTPWFYSMMSRTLANPTLGLAPSWTQPPIVFTEHGRSFPDMRRPKRVLANHLFIGRRDRIVAVGQHVAEALVANEGIPRSRVEVVYNGVDTVQFRRNEAERNRARLELNISEQEIAIFQVARLNVLKNHRTAIEAMKIVCANVNHVKLYLIGDGDQAPHITRWIEQAGLAGFVRMLGQRDDVHRIANAADIFLLTSVSEGIPLTIIEAMACGMPCVATDVGGVAEVILHGKTGLLADSGDFQTLAEHLQQLATDPLARANLGAAGQQRARQVFDAAHMHQQYRTIYRELARSDQPPLERRST